MGHGVRLVAAQGDWREQVKKQDLRRKVRKRAMKLLQFAADNGIGVHAKGGTVYLVREGK